ncbi:MAG TPA: fibrobacter succinogenes major paralogous domain-containing protein [Prolixibacteraceae bacterium]|nr:fibrobacter succinogenes major paralogous domain-containing protein [Prolixibacteraceae bacterium]
MKKNIRIWIYPLIIMGLFLTLANGCSKSDNTNDPTQSGTVTDIDGNVYKTVTIGTQVWMAENLKTTKYRNGDLIGTTTPATLDLDSQDAPKYQWAYDGNESNVATYGRLYTWFAATDTRNVCPTGWHVPSDAEWTILSTFLGGESVAGGKLKEKGTTHWQSPNTGATNESGFAALPGGMRFPASWSDRFTHIGISGGWWSNTYSYGPSEPNGPSYNDRWFRFLENTDSEVYRSNGGDGFTGCSGFSVRCIKD